MFNYLRRKNFRIFWSLSSAIMMCIAVSPLYGDVDKTGASDVIKSFNAALLESMKGADDLDFSGRYRILEEVMKDVFDLSFMARKSAGRHWKKLTPDQKKLLYEKYAEWSISSYAGRFDHYKGEQFNLLTEEKYSRGTITVVSQLKKASKVPVDFHYRLRKKDSKWRIVDIHIAGVSQLAVTRSQFVSIIKKDGFDELIRKLEDKINEFSESKDQ
jgi:phospholipid transport system substrate-binding protein